MIPEAAVEAALEMFWAKEDEPYIDAMRLAIEAAAPHMLAGGWAQAYAAGFLTATEGRSYDAITSNPHRSQE